MKKVWPPPARYAMADSDHAPTQCTPHTEVIHHLLRQADQDMTTGVPTGPAKVVDQLLLAWLRRVSEGCIPTLSIFPRF